jgi:WD40 repeat protein
MDRGKRGLFDSDLGRRNGHPDWVTVRAQVPAKDLILGKLSVWSINVLSNFAAKTTRIVPAPLRTMVTTTIPRATSPGTQICKIFYLLILSSNFLPLPELLRVLTHLIANGRVRSVAWSPDGTKIASGSDDETVKVWNAQTGQCVSTLTGHSEW